MPQVYVTPGVQSLMNAYDRQAQNIDNVKQRNAVLRQQQWAREYDQLKRYEDQIFAYDNMYNDLLARGVSVDQADKYMQSMNIADAKHRLMQAIKSLTLKGPTLEQAKKALNSQRLVPGGVGMNSPFGG